MISVDFRQLLPVIEEANRAKNVDYTLKYFTTRWYKDMVILSLHENMRVKNEMINHPNESDLCQQLK